MKSASKRLAEFSINPVRDLGQNFLVDGNLLDLIVRESRLESGDVVLEIGGGLGTLSERLAPVCKHLHVLEIDRRLAGPLEQAIAGRSNISLEIADAVTFDLASLDPAPTKVVSNLPYGVATPVVMRTIKELPQVDFWCLMVQREIADRLAAEPGSKQYGAVSVVVQLSCKVEFLRPVSRTVFIPQPNVDSALISLTRFAPAIEPRLRSFVRACFQHRRKTLASSVVYAAEAGHFSTELSGQQLKAELVTALAALGESHNQRAEELAPGQFVELLGRLDASSAS